MIVPAEGDFRLESEAETARLGAALARALEKGEAICLSGPLGAGKSALARALIRTLSPAEGDVPSPTFTLVQFYDGPDFPLAHFDLYRLAAADEAFEIGLDEALKDGAVVIEWAERLGHHLPHDRLDVEFEEGFEGHQRRVRLTPHGAWEERALDL
ncbi:MAG TPA: tRNA (adenosine(37)-N6)-threonylcarbamoyltransferase complex ATPase subunit type 1 TsaE [Caulobacteraceae bacterium]|nr:tRNA (adenosine(37)-N6)-threonylcarbamoyltransferase complex ATPase subunit type 1 TsaE [Caulobacteraceae bacterium]